MLCRECGLNDSFEMTYVNDYICADCHNLIKTDFKTTNSNDNNVR